MDSNKLIDKLSGTITKRGNHTFNLNEEHFKVFTQICNERGWKYSQVIEELIVDFNQNMPRLKGGKKPQKSPDS